MGFTKYIIDKCEELADYELIEQLDNLGFIGAEETESHWLVYFDSDSKDVVHLLKQSNRSFTQTNIPEQNWNKLWESNYEAVEVDQFCYIKAVFHPEKSGFEHVIHITPKMSFGTGHHATTWQMLKMMKELDFKDKVVLDFGTGTGILAIMSEKLHAKQILAIDNDEWAVENAKENCALNHCFKILIQKNTISDLPDSKFDIILANINRKVLLDNFKEMKKRLKPNGHLLISGIIEQDIPVVSIDLNKYGFRIKTTIQKDNWVCMLCVLGDH